MKEHKKVNTKNLASSYKIKDKLRGCYTEIIPIQPQQYTRFLRWYKFWLYESQKEEVSFYRNCGVESMEVKNKNLVLSVEFM